MPRQDASNAPAPLWVLWVGDAGPAQRFVDQFASFLHVTACDVPSLQGHIEARAAEQRPAFDAVVIDTTDIPDVPRLVTSVEAAAPQLAVVLLVPPQPDGDFPRLAGLGITDCVAKTPDFMHQVVPAIMQVRARQDLMTVFRATSERETRLRSILDMQPAVAILVDPAGRMTAVNRAGLQLFGDPVGTAIVGRVFLEFVPEVERAGVRVLLSGGRPPDCVEHTLTRADGTLLYVRTRAAAFPHRDGAASLVTIDDQTALRATPDDDEERVRLATLVEAQAAELERLRRIVTAGADEEWEDVLGEKFDVTAPRAQTNDSANAPRDAESDDSARLAGELQDARAEIQRLSETQQQTDAELRALSDEARRLREGLDTTRQALDSSAVEHRAALEQAGADHERLTAMLNEVLMDLQGLACEYEAWEQAMASARVHSQTRESALAALSGERDRLEARLQEMTLGNQRLESELELSRDAVTTARVEAVSARLELSEAVAERERLETALRELQADLERAASESAQLKLKAGEAEHDGEAVRAELTRLTAERDRLASMLQTALSDLQHLVEVSEHWQQLADAARKESDSLQESLSAVQRELAEASRQRSLIASERDRLSGAVRAALSCLQAEDSASATATALPVPTETAPLDTVEPPLLPHSFAASALASDAGVEPTPASASGRERRRHPRIPGMFEGERLGLIDTPLQIQNLSIGGCFITSSSPPPSVPRFDMRIDLGAQGMVEATARIAFVAEEIGYGVSFVSMTDAARRQIAAAVEAASATGLPAARPGRITSAAWATESQVVSIRTDAAGDAPVTSPSNTSPFVSESNAIRATGS